MEHNDSNSQFGVVTKKIVIKIPATITNRSDISRLLSGLDNYANDLQRQKVLNHDDSAIKIGKSLQELAEINNLELTDMAVVEKISQQLKLIYESSPLIHMSFSANPSDRFIEKIIVWLRKEIDPYVLLTIGLQPKIGAGFTMRTTNRYFDFSLGKNFNQKEQLLIDLMREKS